MLKVIGWLAARIGIDFAEQLAGRLIVESARRRVRRAGFDDAHEVRHLYVALLGGDSSECGRGGAFCQLDRIA
jgi:hypothetical protein